MAASTVSIGTISHGTLRNEDLIGAFEWELQRLDPSDSSPLAAIIARYRDGSEDAMPDEDADEDAWDDWYDTEAASEYVNDLADALNDMAPAFCYFGTLEGDSSDFGFWPMDIRDIQDDEDVLTVSDLAELPDAPTSGMYNTPYVLLVNDHGNCTMYSRENSKLTELWSIV